MSEANFQEFLSQVASRLRHDLKGGLITLKMGLESLDDEEGLKPLLMEKTQELVDLSDKLVLLLRMGQVDKQRVSPLGLCKQVASRAEELYPQLKVHVPENADVGRWSLDPDAVIYAALELCQNATHAGAKSVTIGLARGQEQNSVIFTDDGEGWPQETALSDMVQLGRSGWGRSGLGLAVVDRCMKEHGGRFRLAKESASTKAILDFHPEEVN